MSRKLLPVATLLFGMAFLAQEASAQSTNRHARDGFWFSGGLGIGSLGCQNCDSRETGLSGGLQVGGALSQRLLIGAGTSGWTKEIDGVRTTAGALNAIVRFYPSETGGFFLLGGLGIGTFSVEFSGISVSETGAAATLGLGYDLRVGPMVSVTPFWNGVGMSFSDGDANYGQLGVGVTLH